MEFDYKGRRYRVENVDYSASRVAFWARGFLAVGQIKWGESIPPEILEVEKVVLLSDTDIYQAVETFGALKATRID